MKVMTLEIPQTAIDAGNKAMVDGFQACDVAGAVSVVLHDLYYQQPLHEHFDYGIQDKQAVHDRVADRLIQNAKKAGRIRRTNGRWAVVA